MIEFLKLVFHAPVEKEETWSDWWVKVAPTAEHISPILEAVLWVAERDHNQGPGAEDRG
jgi:hypothetical protein